MWLLSRVLAQDGGGQGVLSRPEGEGLRADQVRGRMTPARAIESSVIGSHQRLGFRKDERRLDGTRRKSVKFQPDPTDHKADPATGTRDECGSLAQVVGGQGALTTPVSSGVASRPQDVADFARRKRTESKRMASAVDRNPRG